MQEEAQADEESWDRRIPCRTQPSISTFGASLRLSIAGGGSCAAALLAAATPRR